MEELRPLELIIERNDLGEHIKSEDAEGNEKDLGSQYASENNIIDSRLFNELENNDTSDATAHNMPDKSGTNPGFVSDTNNKSVSPSCLSENLNTNGLDSKIKQIVEDAISPLSKQAVMKILDQINQLSTAEKLFLYLKLPAGKTEDVDPLRQPLNPLGSRFEIHQTITWIRTHLKEDQDVSLPKQDVYDEYITYCNTNKMKPLSTADFGKVMKQVFPHVRPRRLGTRGNSRYCYAGMCKRMKLETPVLPDIGDYVKFPFNHGCEDEILSAASCLIREWAEKLLGVHFDSLHELACHLVEKLCVDSRSVAAFTLLSNKKPNCKYKDVSSPLGLAVPCHANKHRETQLQLQRKLQEREVIREQKRKLQDQQLRTAHSRNQNSERLKSKRAKMVGQHGIHNNTSVPLISCTRNSFTQGNSPPPMSLQMPNTSEILFTNVCDNTISSLPGSLSADNSSSETKIGKAVSVPKKLCNEVLSRSAGCKTDDTYVCRDDECVQLKDGSKTVSATGKSDLRSVRNSISDSKVPQFDFTDCALSVNTNDLRESVSVPSSVGDVNVVNNPINASSTKSCCNVSSSGQSVYPSANSNDTSKNNIVKLLNTSRPLITKPVRSCSVQAPKLPIPRLNNQRSNKSANVIIFPPTLSSQKFGKKYKHIQPKPNSGNDKVSEEPECMFEDNQKTMINDAELSNDFILEANSLNSPNYNETLVIAKKCNTEVVQENCPEVSIGCLEKDALNDYFHGGNNSQEQEDELIKYFQHQNNSNNEEIEEMSLQPKNVSCFPSTSAVEFNRSKSDKLSQLRLLLERNLNPSSKKDTVSSLKMYGMSSFRSKSYDAGASFSTDSISEIEYKKPVIQIPRGSSASESLSLLSQRSQQQANFTAKPTLLLSSLLSNHNSSLSSRRRVSFETPMIDQFQEGVPHNTVPQSPNTRRRIFSFTPISPGPHSPGSTQPKSSKPSSANVSPFVSPRNTPVLRSRNCSGQQLNSNNILGISSVKNNSSAFAASAHKQTTNAAKIVRSNSVNSMSPSACPAPRPRALSTTNSLLLSSNTFCIETMNPGKLSPTPIGNRVDNNTMFILPGDFDQTKSNSDDTSTITDDVLGKHADNILQSTLKSDRNTKIFSSDITTNQKEIRTHNDVQDVDETSNISLLISGTNADPLAHEVSQFFPDEQPSFEPLFNVSQLQYRSQSVPLHRMSANACNISQSSPLYTSQKSNFTFNHFASSTTSSVTPTPVPSEFTDFAGIADNSTQSSNLLIVDDDGNDPDTNGLNSENLNRIFHLLDETQDDDNPQVSALSLSLEDEINGSDLQINNNRFLLQPSRSYPNTPLPYKNVGDQILSFNNSVNSVEVQSNPTSRSYPSTPLLNMPDYGNTDEQTLQNLNDGDTCDNQLTLNAINIIQTISGNFSARRNINSLLEQAPFSVEDEISLALSDSLNQLATEVGNTNSQPP